METKSTKNIETEVLNFEKFIGPLTEKFPFTFSTFYHRDNKPCMSTRSLNLNPDGTYQAELSLNSNEGYSSSISYTTEGKFTYEVLKRTLVLEEKVRKIERLYDCYKQVTEETAIVTDIFEKVFPKRFEIPDFTWISPTIQWPWIRLVKPFPDADYTQCDVSNYFVEMCEIDTKYEGERQFLKILELVELINSKISSATTIEKPVKYENLTLYPDGTLAFCSETYEYNDVFKWDSSFTYAGKWKYDVDKRIISLTYENFRINNNRVIEDAKIYDLQDGKVDETKDFYFEGNFINAVSCRWSYDIAKSIGTTLLKKEI